MPRHAYLFSINPNTPPLMKVMPDEEFRIEVLGITGKLRVGTSPRPVMCARLMIPRAVLEAAGMTRVV